MAPNGIISTIAGSSHDGYTGDGGPALNAEFDFPQGLLLDGLGNIYISDTQNNVIRVLSIPGPTIVTNGVVNSASFKPGISPGSLATIFGSNVATSTTTQATLPLPLSLAEASVSVNGRSRADSLRVSNAD